MPKLHSVLPFFEQLYIHMPGHYHPRKANITLQFIDGQHSGIRIFEVKFGKHNSYGRDIDSFDREVTSYISSYGWAIPMYSVRS